MGCAATTTEETDVQPLSGICPVCGGTGRADRRSEWWVVQAGGFDVRRGLDYWGPFPSASQAKASGMFRPESGMVIVEVPA